MLAQPRWAPVVLDGGPERVVKVVIAGGDGAIDPARAPLPGLAAADLAAYARRLDVGAVVVIERSVIAQLSFEIEAALSPIQDGLEQALVALRALKHHAGRGVWTEPPLLDLVPAPGFDAVQRTFDLLVPDRSALLAYVIEDDRQRVHT